MHKLFIYFFQKSTKFYQIFHSFLIFELIETLINFIFLYHLSPYSVKGGIQNMAKLTAWLVTLIGVLLVLPLIKVDIEATLNSWLIALAVLVIGVAKLMRNYSGKKRR
jgi:hypothetical protein